MDACRVLTPLIYAASGRRHSTAEMLLAHGASDHARVGARATRREAIAGGVGGAAAEPSSRELLVAAGWACAHLDDVVMDESGRRMRALLEVAAHARCVGEVVGNWCSARHIAFPLAVSVAARSVLLCALPGRGTVASALPREVLLKIVALVAERWPIT
eukprot:SAG11_NODE_3390_length_2478_cov_2.929382_2_plen_159_part_00